VSQKSVSFRSADACIRELSEEPGTFAAMWASVHPFYHFLNSRGLRIVNQVLSDAVPEGLLDNKAFQQ